MLGQIAKTLLRARYIVIGSVVGGGYTLSQTIQSWKDRLPDLDWLSDRLPDSEYVDFVIGNLKRLPMAIEERGRTFLDEEGALRKAQKWFARNVYAPFNNGLTNFRQSVDVEQMVSAWSPPMMRDDKIPTENEENSLVAQLKFQKEIERLEKENAQLRQLLTVTVEKSGERQIQPSLIDMYSDVLDLLTQYDSSYNMVDHLPRVVVVGDQSAGKTSVLEMIAQARIFPRGSGEMMTRAPVKVTLSEGPYHVARFRDSQREFHLAKESELAELRREIELRMRNSVLDGKTVSKDVIALTVQGPALPRMVLIDLPGIISTVTTEMASETKNDIIDICKCHMENPNAIILCIQDGSVDAERSNVTDLVSSLDPQGRRTLVVLTKVDLAEENLANPDRVKKILEGKLFPMKALGYFAVVTGRGNTNDSIEAIRNYEETFFTNSSLFKRASLKPSQMTTRNMSTAVSERFWKMVQDSIEQQADSFKAMRFNLETEWRNAFPNKREMDRDELFQMVRNEMLDNIVKLNSTTAKEWESLLQKELWNRMNNFIFQNVLLPAAVEKSKTSFDTKADIKLKHWVDKRLPDKCIEAAWCCLKSRLSQMLEEKPNNADYSTVLTPLKNAVLDKAISSYSWDKKAYEYLKMVQTSALEDRVVPDKKGWSEAVQFYERAVQCRIGEIEERLTKMLGPSWSERMFKWKHLKDAQARRQVIAEELRPLLKTRQMRDPFLDRDEMAVVHRHMAERRNDITVDEIRDVWHYLYQDFFLKRNLSAAKDCAGLFFHYQSDFLDADCSGVVLFWRLQRMLNATVNTLRQQIVNTEIKRIEAEVKKTLFDWSAQSDVKKKFLTGRQVELAEELRQVRLIQEKLEEFIRALKSGHRDKG